MMITTRDEFEDALQRVLGYLAKPPAPDSAEDRDFTTLLSRLQSYRGRIVRQEACDEAVASSFRHLDREFDRFRRRHADRPQAGAFSSFGFGRDLERRS